MRHAICLWLAACTNEVTWRGEAEPPPRPVLGTVPPAEVVEDRILQMVAPKVDVLWVIDPSCSMGPFQDALTANFPSFMNFFASRGLEYHVGVTSTDMDGVLDDGSLGRLRTMGGDPFITPTTPDPVGRFANIADLGIRGSSSERGTSAVHAALTTRDREENLGFLRPSAALHTIVISDESNQIAPGEPEFEEWLSWYGGLKLSPELRTFSSITSVLGFQYEDASHRLGGITWPIETEQWAVVLERLGFRAAGLHSEYFLSRVPAPWTIEVWLEREGVPQAPNDTIIVRLDEGTEWTYDRARNAIRLVDEPPDYTVLVGIRYQTADGFPPR